MTLGNGDGSEPIDEAQLALERSLIDSARADALPEGATERAWKRFATSANALALGAGERAASVSPANAERAARATAAKWLLLGALGGSALTAAWFAARVTPSIATPKTEPGTAPAAAAASVGPQNDWTVKSAVPAASSLPPEAPWASLVESPQSTAPRIRRNALPRGSTLAAEITLLDSVRAALAGGAPDQALRTVERYRQKFPAGLLAADAEALAIEALVEQGERAAAAQRARRFLARHPNDPHAPRVRELAGD
jgi:hypothetical protein